MKKNSVILIMVLAGTVYLQAQTACERVINDGIALFNSGKYAEAKVKFEAAKRIPCADAQSWIDQCDTKQRASAVTSVGRNRENRVADCAPAIEMLQRENDKLRSANDSLHRIINASHESRRGQNSVREAKANNILKFSDPAFEAFLVKYYDKNLDGKISQLEAEEITKLEISKQKINSLGGIENLSNLQMLDCSRNKLTQLDVSKNTSLKMLICNNNTILSLNISGCRDLTELNCSNNKLLTLNLSSTPNLKTLNCSNNGLTSLTTDNGSQLESLICVNNKISRIDISNSRLLKKLECQRNAISMLDVSANNRLVELNCSSNQLTILSVDKNKALTWLNCSGNQLTSLSVRNGTSFSFLDCRANSKHLVVRIDYAQKFRELKKGKKIVMSSK